MIKIINAYIIVAATAMFGCGTTSDMDQVIGDWHGTAEIDTPDVGTVSIPMTVVARTNPASCDPGNAVHLSNLCPAGGGTLLLAPGQREWAGGMVCSPTRVGGCPDATFVLQRFAFDVSDSTLNGVGSGRLSGCDRNVPAAFRFQSSRLQ